VACDDVSVALILDNSASTARVRLRLPAHPDVVLGAGDTLVLSGLPEPLALAEARLLDG
jgi:hypothetical protein